MTTKRSLAAVLMAALLGTPLVAGAQTPPTPPKPAPAPAPAPVPMPRIEQLLLDPLVLDLSSLARLDDLQLRSMDQARLLTLDGRLLDLATIDALDLQRDAMEQARGAMDQARTAMGDATRMQETAIYRRNGDTYNSGKDALNARRYAEAIMAFDKVIAAKSTNADGAAYWKAYAQYKLGKTEESIATIAALRREQPQSRYLADAKVLEADARKVSGQPVDPAAMNDDELKILALNSLKNVEPERVIPLVEGVLAATNSLRVKRQALYVLAGMNNQPRAHQILLNYAKGGGNPDLQIEAIRYLAANSDKKVAGAELMQIYQGTQDTDVKLAVISALRSSGNGGSLISIATTSSNPVVVRSSALNGLSGTVGPAELMSLYEKETNKELRSQIVGLLGSANATEQLKTVIRTEKEPDIVRRAIRALGYQDKGKTGPMLVELYSAQQDVETRRAIISALSSQDNAESLVALARKEPSLPLKTEIVRKLSEMAPKSKVAADYLMEIIK